MGFRYNASVRGLLCLSLGGSIFACSGSEGGGTGPTTLGASDGTGGTPVGGGSGGGTAPGASGTGGFPSSLPVAGTRSNGGTAALVTGTKATGGTNAITSISAQGGSSSVGGAAVTGGSLQRGGSSSTGGNVTGGTKTVAGSPATGGTRNTSGSSSGGSRALGGNSTTGGNSATGGTRAMGGNSATGGLSNTGGMSSTTPGSDGCTDTLALGVTLTEVAVFQSGKISVMKNGAAVTASTTYGADIVEARPTLFRAYVAVDSGFQSRQLSARLVLNDGSSSYYSKQTIGASSTELSAANSFTISVPASDIKAGLNYSIQIVECATGSGSTHDPRFPASGQADLVTRLTGPIKITAIPVTANNITPTLDSTFTSNLKKVFDAMYPTSDTQVSASSTPITGCAITPSSASDGTAWSNCLDLVRSRRSADRPAADVYYLGILTPATTLSGFCGSSCIAGISFEATATGASGRASLAIGYMPQAQNTCAHEVGHAHGLAHSPGCGAGSPDANFPYVTNGKAYIGWTGWDNRAPTTFLNPATVTDIMAYCTTQWVSDYVYSKWEDRVATLNGAAEMIGVETGTWRVLNIVGNSVRWGQPIVYPEPPSGDPVGATVLDSSSQAIQEITVYRTNIAIDAPTAVPAASYMIPEPADYWDSVQIGDAVAKFQ